MPDLPQFSARQFFDGPPVRVGYQAGLRDTAGNPAHAAASIRYRKILLDPGLKSNRNEHRRVLLHEYFHFAWVRLGNPRRHKWEVFLASEWKASVPGEAGWSAEWRKRLLSREDVEGRSRRWRDYCCESFCDTGAWVAGGGSREITLPAVRRIARRAWFKQNFDNLLFRI